MTTYTHQGTTINFDATKAEFYTSIKNEMRSFGSLASAKKAIDDARKNDFEEFYAYPATTLKYLTAKHQPRSVVIKDRKAVKQPGRYGSTNTYFISGDNSQYRGVYKALPEVSALFLKAGEIADAYRKEESERDKKFDADIKAIEEALEPYWVPAVD